MAEVEMLTKLTESGVKTNVVLLLSREEFNTIEVALDYAAECARNRDYISLARKCASVTLDIISQFNQIIKSIN